MRAGANPAGKGNLHEVCLCPVNFKFKNYSDGEFVSFRVTVALYAILMTCHEKSFFFPGFKCLDVLEILHV